MIKALFFDIDGTLVSFNTHSIPSSAVEGIRAAHAKGIRTFIATGRPAVIINNLSPLQELGLIDGYVTMNGAYCFTGNEVIHRSSIAHADVETLAKFSAEKQIPCIFVSEDDICVCQPNRLVQTIFNEHLKVDALPVSTPKEVIGQEIFQMTAFVTKEQESDILPLLPACASARWHPAFTDITAKENSKQQGIERMIARFGIRREEVMTFGDGGNDTGMLQYAGIGVAMGNATDEVKRHADYVTSSVDEDGVAHALRHFAII